MKRNSTLNSLLALSLLALPAYAVAENARDVQQIRVADAKPHHHQRHDPVKRAQRQLDQLAEKLKLTDAQQPAWQAYSQATLTRAQERGEKMKAFHAQRSDARERGEARQKFDTATRMEKMAEQMRARAATLDQVAQDTRALQQALTPEQQDALDAYWKSMRHHGKKAHRAA